MCENSLYFIKSKAYKEMILYNPKQYLPDIEVPVLVLNGDEDIFVPASENVASFKEISMLDEVFATEVLENIAQWIWEMYRDDNK